LAKPVIHRRKRLPGKAVECADAVKRWIEGRGKPLNVRRLNSLRITERLASRVKGLTGLFELLLLTSLITPPSGGHCDARQKVF
jgi:hypothetical protein